MMEIDIPLPIYKEEYRQRIEENVEIWASLAHMEFPSFEVSSFGKVRRIGNETPIAQLNRNTKSCVTMNRKSRTVAVLVAGTFIVAPLDNDGTKHYSVNCIDRDLSNSHVTNLRYVTASERNLLKRKTDNNLCHGIIQSDTNGTEVRKWDGIKSIIMENPSYDTYRILTHGIKNGKSIYGYFWRYNRDDIDDDEFWVYHPTIEGLQASNYGRIKHRDGVPRYGCKTVLGYLSTLHNGTSILVHRIIAECFLTSEMDGLVVNHINGRKDDNNMENLEVVTATQNNRHAVETGLVKTRPVIQIDPCTGIVLKIYPNSREASKANGLEMVDGISAMCRKKAKGTLAGYCWRYESDTDYVDQVTALKKGIVLDKTVTVKPFYTKKTTKSVLKIDPKTDDIIKVYDMITEAAREHLRTNGAIATACRDNLTLSAGYHWRYASDPLYQSKLTAYREEHPVEIPDTRRSSYTPRNTTSPVLKIDTESDRILGLYDNIKVAATGNDIKNPTAITKVCKKSRNLAGGFKWRYADDPEYESKLASFKRKKEANDDGPSKKKRKTA